MVELAQPADPPLPDLPEEDVPSDICSSPIIAPTAAEVESQVENFALFLKLFFYESPTSFIPVGAQPLMTFIL